MRFGDPTVPSGTGSGSTSGLAGAGAAPAGPTPTTPTSTGETAGKVLTLENGVLTIALNGGTRVSGQVTERTGLICLPATPPTSTGGDDQGGGDDASGGQEGEHGALPSQPSSSGVWSGEDHQQSEGDEGDEQNTDNEDNQRQGCETTALTAGAVVREAELSLTSSGAVWQKIVLVH